MSDAPTRKRGRPPAEIAPEQRVEDRKSVV
jgi:hypothetical protein